MIDETRKVYGLWHGGSSYAPGGVDEIEVFDDLSTAKIELWERWRTEEGGFRFLSKDGEMTVQKTPAVELEETAMCVWGEPPPLDADLYPEKILTLAKKEERPGEIGAVVREEDG